MRHDDLEIIGMNSALSRFGYFRDRGPIKYNSLLVTRTMDLNLLICCSLFLCLNPFKSSPYNRDPLFNISMMYNIYAAKVPELKSKKVQKKYGILYF